MNEVTDCALWFCAGATAGGLIGFFFYLEKVKDQFNGWKF